MYRQFTFAAALCLALPTGAFAQGSFGTTQPGFPATPPGTVPMPVPVTPPPTNFGGSFGAAPPTGNFGGSFGTPAPTPAPTPDGVRLLASDPASIQAAIQSEGFQARLTRDDAGDPMITGKISRTDYWVYFLDCNNGANCLGIEFHSGYILDREVTFEEMNRFNQGYRYIRAYLNDNGDPRMQMDILMRDQGLPLDTFHTYLDLWRQLIVLWEDFLGV